MSVTEHLMRPGSGSVRFVADIPATVTDAIVELVDENAGGPGAAVVITSEHLDPVDFGDANTLDAAIYNGPITGRPSRRSLEFAGLGVWLDSYLDANVSRSAGTPTQWVGDLVANGLTVGTITGLSNVSRTFPAHSVSRREALDAWARLAGGEYRINPDFTVDAAAAATLFVSPPTTAVTRHEEGPDGSLRGIDGGLLDQALARVGPSIPTKAVALAQGEGAAIVKGTATRALNLLTPMGAAPSIVTVFSAPSEESANANSAASNFLNLQGARRQVSVSSSTHALPRLVKPGDEVWLWDPTAGLIDLTNQILYRGETIFPMLVRLLSYTWPIRSGYGVYIRPNAAAPEWIDVTDWVEWDQGDTFWTVGDWSPPSYGPTNRTSPEIEERIAGDTATSGLYTDSGASIPQNTSTTITLTAVSDPNGWLSAGNVVPTVAGRYEVSVSIEWQALTTPTVTRVVILRNESASTVLGGVDNAPDPANGASTNNVVGYVHMDGSTDSIGVRLFHDSTGGTIPQDVIVAVKLLPGH